MKEGTKRDSIYKMPLLHIYDLPIILALTIKRWIFTINFLIKIRASTLLNGLQSIGEIYQRNNILIYLYLLAIWTKISGKHLAVLESPDRLVVAELFIRYIVEIDQILDSYDSRYFLKNNPYLYNKSTNFKNIKSELLFAIDKLKIPIDTKKKILVEIVIYRKNAISIFRHRTSYKRETLSQVHSDKRSTAGNLWESWATILNLLYGVQNRTSQKTKKFFFITGMLMQMLDDIVDVNEDVRVDTHNLFVSCIRENSSEWEKFLIFLSRSPNINILQWACDNLPKTIKLYHSIYKSYLEDLLDEESNFPSIKNINPFVVFYRLFFTPLCCASIPSAIAQYSKLKNKQNDV